MEQLTFDNGFARNVAIFGFDNNSSLHSENGKNNSLILGAGPTYGINGSFDAPEKKSLVLILLKFIINFV